VHRRELVQPAGKRREKDTFMSDLKKKTKDKIDSTAEAAKNATEKIGDKSKDIAHASGKKIDEGAKKLKDA
jgi:hypothetical protein